MRVLFLAPMPPPVTGHSLVSALLAERLAAEHAVHVIDIGRASTNVGRVTSARLWATVLVLLQVLRRFRADRTYLTISETLAGNLKDLAIYALHAGRLRSLFAHLHGGSLGRLLLDRRPWLRRINGFFLRRLGGVIISGDSHRGIFTGLVEPGRVHVIENFAQDSMFVGPPEIEEKFTHDTPLRLLYMSGMTEQKGYAALLDGFLALPAKQRAQLQVDFAGRFDTDAQRTAFQARLDGVAGVAYHGVVDDAAKRALFAGAHVFCLPTSHLEGQPISLLEAYAAGCVPLTTVPPGIRDIFDPPVQGFALAEGSAAAVAQGLGQVLAARPRLAAIALANRALADRRYRLTTFSNSINAVISHG
jgi:glycosyltransferase involved in cell wall biosynthesis